MSMYVCVWYVGILGVFMCVCVYVVCGMLGHVVACVCMCVRCAVCSGLCPEEDRLLILP